MKTTDEGEPAAHMLFPRPGSYNPTYTGVNMAFGLARRLTSR